MSRLAPLPSRPLSPLLLLSQLILANLFLSPPPFPPPRKDQTYRLRSVTILQSHLLTPTPACLLREAAVAIALVQRTLLAHTILECGARDQALTVLVCLQDIGKLFLRGFRGLGEALRGVLGPDVGVAITVG
ncbi:hypothetical protein B9Z19DRAFT_1063863 [Tuber borchii]|uniref:Secreted protein n=1 Tax=Tuber borchii TaxID=42251 RepID=A0A2T6ZWK4_TUBBO|nr:hypothetical protein B9Z19DRAFT_1063863 [Tuber borchii]